MWLKSKEIEGKWTAGWNAICRQVQREGGKKQDERAVFAVTAAKVTKQREARQRERETERLVYTAVEAEREAAKDGSIFFS